VASLQGIDMKINKISILASFVTYQSIQSYDNLKFVLQSDSDYIFSNLYKLLEWGTLDFEKTKSKVDF